MAVPLISKLGPAKLHLLTLSSNVCLQSHNGILAQFIQKLFDSPKNFNLPQKSPKKAVSWSVQTFQHTLKSPKTEFYFFLSQKIWLFYFWIKKPKIPQCKSNFCIFVRFLTSIIVSTPLKVFHHHFPIFSNMFVKSRKRRAFTQIVLLLLFFYVVLPTSVLSFYYVEETWILLAI